MTAAASPLPNWPALMDRQLAADYLQLGPRSFDLLVRLHGVAPVDCAGLNLRRWRRTDLDALIDNLPARGASMAHQAGGAPPEAPTDGADQLAAQALAKAARRVKR